jgi:hypothetical protein
MIGEKDAKAIVFVKHNVGDPSVLVAVDLYADIPRPIAVEVIDNHPPDLSITTHMNVSRVVEAGRS